MACGNLWTVDFDNQSGTGLDMTMQPDTLRKLPYFARLDPPTLDALASQVEVISLERGQVLINEGYPCVGLYFVVEGSVKVSRVSPEGKEQVLTVMGSLQTFNPVPVFDGGLNAATVTASEQTVVGLVPKALMLGLVHEHGEVAEGLLRIFASRLRGLTTLVSDLTHLDVAGRIAKVLLSYQSSSGVTELHISQQDLASMVGTTREVAARALRTLEQEGCLLRRGRTIEIRSTENLEKAMDSSAR